jgi:Ran GTPase-activating protein (RanGAP) involved in mRNA processing and transport
VHRCIRRQVDLSYDDLQAQGAKALALAILKSGSLTSINLSHNRISGRACKTIAKAIIGSSSLASIDLSANDLEKETGLFGRRIHTTKGSKTIAGAVRDRARQSRGVQVLL